MKIRIISVGKLKERWFHEAQAEYLKRLSRFARIEIEEVRDEPAPKNASAGEIEVLMKKEGERIRAAIDNGGGEIIILTPGQEAGLLWLCRNGKEIRRYGKRHDICHRRLLWHQQRYKGPNRDAAELLRFDIPAQAVPHHAA